MRRESSDPQRGFLEVKDTRGRFLIIGRSLRGLTPRSEIKEAVEAEYGFKKPTLRIDLVLGGSEDPSAGTQRV